MKILLVGNPNVGKSVIFNRLTGMNVVVSNYPGTTVDYTHGKMRINETKAELIDVPGNYSLDPSSRAEEIAVEMIDGMTGDDDLIVNVLDATRLERNLRLTLELLKTGKPMIVALNKMDRDNAAPDQVKQQLSDIGIVPDDWEGDTIIVPISAIEKTGLDDLMEAILLIADDLEIYANPQGDVFGTVIEAELTKGRGVMATLLIQNGTLKVGDTVLAGTSYGRIKAMFDYNGNKIFLASNIPYSPKNTCGECHDYDAITNAYHFQQGRTDAKGNIIIRDDMDSKNPWLMSHGMYGKW